MVIVGLGEYYAVRPPEEGLRTYALGSCVAIILYDAPSKVAAMAHAALPDSGLDYARASVRPGYFADTAVPALLRAFKEANAGWLPPNLQARLVGGGSILKTHAAFQIGQRNIEMAQRSLREHGINILREDVGGAISRSASISLTTGVVTVYSPNRPLREL